MARKTNIEINGSEYFRVTASIGRDSNGKLIRKQFYGASKKEAEAKRDEYLNGIKNGLNFDYKTLTFGPLIHSWLFEKIRVSIEIKPSTFQRYEGIYRNYIKSSKLYGLKISDIKPIQIQRYYNELYENGKGSNPIKTLNKLIKTFFNYAVDEGYILKNPCLGKKIIIPGKTDTTDIDSEDIKIYTDEEINLLKNTLKSHRLKACILLALGTGLRLGELLALEWTDISDDYSELKVQRSIKEVNIISADGSKEYKTIIQTPKTKNSIRTVPIPSNLIPILTEHRINQEKEKNKVGNSYIESNFVFTTELGKNIDSNNLRKSFKRILDKAGIEHKKFHSLRHTYITKLFEAGVPLKTVQILAGHADISVTANIYTHVMPKEKIIAVEKLNKLFD
jgi:integrase